MAYLLVHGVQVQRPLERHRQQVGLVAVAQGTLLGSSLGWLLGVGGEYTSERTRDFGEIFEGGIHLEGSLGLFQGRAPTSLPRIEHVVLLGEWVMWAEGGGGWGRGKNGLHGVSAKCCLPEDPHYGCAENLVNV